MTRQPGLSSLPPLRIALFTYSTKPRGGVVHTLALAEQLQAQGQQVHVFALSNGQQDCFYRPTAVPFTLIPALAPPAEEEPLDRRIQRYIETYDHFLSQHRPGGFDIYHAQDCISANALWRVREKGLLRAFARTIHHLDDFVSPVLIKCQQDAIDRPDHRLVVSHYWRDTLAREFGVSSTVIHNGVDVERFHPPSPTEQATARAEWKVTDRFVFTNIGGIEPRKNTICLLLAFQAIRPHLVATGLKPVLLLAGGETLLDYRSYRAEFFHLLNHSGLEQGQDVFLLGTLSDSQIESLYQATDVFTFPSVKEGWGLVVLEAMASKVPVLAADLPVFREYLQAGQNAMLIDPHDMATLVATMRRLATEPLLRQRLAEAGLATAHAFSWATTARRHIEFYRELLAGSAADPAPQPDLMEKL
jgi:glycosyltransferase-like protein